MLSKETFEILRKSIVRRVPEGTVELCRDMLGAAGDHFSTWVLACTIVDIEGRVDAAQLCST